MAETADDNGDPSFALLNAYLDQLHAGRNPDRNELLARHPELAGTLECIEAMERLLVPADRVEQESSRVHEEPTRLGVTGRGKDDCGRVEFGAGGDFGDYELLGEIGRGGMGVVYQARQKSLDRCVAIKMILASHLASAEQVDRFYTEARAAARARHPNIVGIHEIGELHGQHYFVMEHVAGRSLAQRLGDGPMDPEEAAACVAKIARAVHHLHQHGIVHRDLKPSNVLQDESGEPYLTDFGLAKTLLADSHMTSTGVIVGTPSYMAPEQAAGRVSEVGPSSDIYSLGALLYDLITGRPPFREATPLDTLVQVLEGEPRLPSQLNQLVPPDLEMICLRCLEKVPDQRYRSADELADDLERFLRGESVEARPPNSFMRVRRWARRQPALASRWSVIALCVTILQVNYALTKGTSDEVEPYVHMAVMTSLAMWAVASFCFQQLISFEKWAEPAIFAWAATDALLLTFVLWLTDTIRSPVVVGYAALIAASGLWFRHRLVWFVTAICVMGYVLLMADWLGRGEELEEPLFRHIILLVFLAGTGSVVAYQVKRIRALSRHYVRRPLP